MSARPDRSRIGTGWQGLLTAALFLVLSSRASAQESAAQRECDYGIAAAFSGQTAKAESVFISLLSHVPGNAAALTNLGNLRLLDRDFDGALEFYKEAARIDTSDAGIVLNEALVLLLAGDEELARERAQLAIHMAGGAPAASSLLGLHYPTGPAGSPRAGEPSHLSREEVLEMIRAAAGRVPADSSRVGKGTRPVTPSGPRKVRWRPAGPRAGEGQSLPTLVYWKRWDRLGDH